MIALMEQCAPHSFTPYEPKFATQSTQFYFHYPLQQQLACQGSRLILVCPSPLVIHIHAAYYGIQSATRSSTCTTSSYEIPAKCYLPHTFDIINATCEYKQSCQLKAASSTLTENMDFCPLYQKQLLIQYMCVHPGDFHTVQAIHQCPINWVVPPICTPKNDSRSMIGVSLSLFLQLFYQLTQLYLIRIFNEITIIQFLFLIGFVFYRFFFYKITK